MEAEVCQYLGRSQRTRRTGRRGQLSASRRLDVLALGVRRGVFGGTKRYFVFFQGAMSVPRNDSSVALVSALGSWSPFRLSCFPFQAASALAVLSSNEVIL